VQSPISLPSSIKDTATKQIIPTFVSSFTVNTDRSSYNAGDIVKVSVSGLVGSENVAITVTAPNGINIILRTLTTGSSGNGSFEFRIPDSAVSGIYTLTGSAQIGSTTETSANTFQIVSDVFGAAPPVFEGVPEVFEGFDSGVNIVSITPTDQNGNPVTSFNAGQLSFAKVVVSSDSPTSALVTVNLFDSELTTIGISSFQTTLSGQSEVVMSFNIPSDAAQGSVNIYANVFSDWPSNDGIPLTSEKSASVLIP